MPLLTKKGTDERKLQMSDVNSALLSTAKTSSPSRVSLSPQSRYDVMLQNGPGVFSSSTPPLSRQRRHSKLHLRVASEISVDQDSQCSQNITNKDRYRIVIMGSSAVGKTAIVEQFLYGSFPTSHSATVEELHKGEYEVGGGGIIPLEILDTSGSFEFPAMRRLAISAGDAFALVYSIDNSETFEEVKRLRETILQVKGETYCPIVVVGNKSDLPEDVRAVKIELAECECIDWDHGFVECSAKNNENIVNIFSSMLIQARLRGALNVTQILASNSPKHHSHHRDQSFHSTGGEHYRSHNQRRRSSLPISELFHRSPGVSGLSLNPNRDRGAFRKRNSCTPS